MTELDSFAVASQSLNSNDGHVSENQSTGQKKLA